MRISSKNWHFWIVLLENILESPLDCKEIKPVNPKGNQPWIFIGRTDAKAAKFWPPDEKNWLIGKTLTLGKIEGKGRRGWQRMRWLNGITDSRDKSLSKLREIVMPGDSLACCSSWGCKESDATEQLNNKKGEPAQHKELYSICCDDLYGRRI